MYHLSDLIISPKYHHLTGLIISLLDIGWSNKGLHYCCSTPVTKYVGTPENNSETDFNLLYHFSDLEMRLSCKFLLTSPRFRSEGHVSTGLRDVVSLSQLNCKITLLPVDSGFPRLFLICCANAFLMTDPQYNLFEIRTVSKVSFVCVTIKQSHLESETL